MVCRCINIICSNAERANERGDETKSEYHMFYASPRLSPSSLSYVSGDDDSVRRNQ